MTIVETKTLYIPNDVTLGVPPMLADYTPIKIESVKLGKLTFDKFEYIPKGIQVSKVNNIYCRYDQ